MPTFCTCPVFSMIHHLKITTLINSHKYETLLKADVMSRTWESCRLMPILCHRDLNVRSKTTQDERH